MNKNKSPFRPSSIGYHVTWWIPVDGPMDQAKAVKTRGSFALRQVHKEEVADIAEARIKREIDGCYDGEEITGFAYLVAPLE